MTGAVLTGHRMVRNGSWWTCMFCPYRVAFPSPWPRPAEPCVPRAWWPELNTPLELVATGDGRAGCPETVWDGPYSSRCSMGETRCAIHGPFDTRRESADEPRCPAHGKERCALCSLNGPCDSCSYYDATGMHWDTCPNRVRSLTSPGVGR